MQRRINSCNSSPTSGKHRPEIGEMSHQPSLSDDARQVGRPNSQKQIVAQNFNAILEQIVQGNLLLRTLEKLGVHWSAFYRLVQQSPKRREAYARARQVRVEKWIDEMVPMTDKVIGQEMAIVTATRNAIDVR